MAGGPRGKEGVLRLTAQDHVNGPTRAARRAQRRVERAQADDRVGVEVAQPLAHRALDALGVLRRVAGLHVAAWRGRGLHLLQTRPEFRILAQRPHHDRVAFGTFGVTRARVVLLEDGVMYDGRRHAHDYARPLRRGQTASLQCASPAGAPSEPRAEASRVLAGAGLRRAAAAPPEPPPERQASRAL